MAIEIGDTVIVQHSLAKDPTISPYLHGFVGKKSVVMRTYNGYAELSPEMGNMMFPTEHLHLIAKPAAVKGLNTFRDECHKAAYQWWHDDEGNKLERNKAELLCLIHSEISEAMEGERKDAMDDHLPHRKMAEVELADALIRIFDYAGAHGYDLDGAYQEKIEYNKQRADHKRENRSRAGGKKF